MNYPLISEYIEAIKSAEDNFEELSYLRPVLGDDGLPVMTRGNFAVVFKMRDERDGKFYAVKCFTKEQEGRAEAYREIAKELKELKDVSLPYLVSIRYLDKELFVDTDQSAETEFPVLLMDWVEGKTLDKYLRENLDDKYALEMLAYRFSQLAQWLIPQSFAHGDLKPDNILVREDGSLVLVDYDGMYVPAMKGQKARELGSPDFRHPLRTEYDFDEHIDDFSLVSILLSLLILSKFPSYWSKYGSEDKLLFSSDDYRAFGNCPKTLEPSESNAIIKELSSILLVLCNNKNASIYNNIPTISMPVNKQKDTEDIIHDTDILYDATYYTNLNLETSFSEIYYLNGIKRFRDGIISIKRGYCKENNRIKELVFPHSLEIIEPYAFYCCSSLLLTNIQDTSITTIGERAFSKCFNLGYVSLPSSLRTIGSFAFALCRFKLLTIPEGVNKIDDYAFCGCAQMQQIILPKSIQNVGKLIFKNCNSLKYIIIPKECREKYSQLLYDYSHLFVFDESIKHNLLKIWKLVDENSYADDYYLSTAFIIDPMGLQLHEKLTMRKR